ncbi:MAG: hypothetical protein EOM20_06445, partial [Spartobacteria bacterium]|nr:hypothetical protein [Spartobacteria bacterium]
MMKKTNVIFGLMLLQVSLWTGLCMGAVSNIHYFGYAAEEGQWPCGDLEKNSGDGWWYGMTPYGGVSNNGTLFRINMASESFETLHIFNGTDGRFPLGAPVFIAATGRLYGVTARGGSNDLGVLFSVKTDGSQYRVEHVFSETAPYSGAFPWGGITHSGIYGTTLRGGINNYGTVFHFDWQSGVFSNLHRFAGDDGRQPMGNLTVSGDHIYGTTSEGGLHGKGTIFEIRHGAGGVNTFTTLHHFTGNDDGANPSGGVILHNGKLYGAARGAATKAGAVFCLNTNGTGMTSLHVFSGQGGDGALPYGSLSAIGDVIVGTTRFGGTHSRGTVFSLGGAFSILHSFTNGGEPYGAVLSDAAGIGYGMANNEGDNRRGSIFKVSGIPLDNGPDAWCALQWIDEGTMGATLHGDWNDRTLYVQHGTNGGAPEAA